jgi:hypothetical protein
MPVGRLRAARADRRDDPTHSTGFSVTETRYNILYVSSSALAVHRYFTCVHDAALCGERHRRTSGRDIPALKMMSRPRGHETDGCRARPQQRRR